MTTEFEIDLRLKCLELAGGNLKKAIDNYLWITTNNKRFEDRI